HRYPAEQMARDAVHAKALQPACSASQSVHAPITRLIAPAEQCSAGTAHCWRVVREHGRNAARRSLTYQQERGASRQRVQVDDIWFFPIQEVAEGGGGVDITVSVEFSEILDLLRHGEPVYGKAIDRVGFVPPAWRSDDWCDTDFALGLG